MNYGLRCARTLTRTRLLCSAVFVLAGCCGPAAQGATVTVNSLADSGPGSLRAAIAAAASGDTINFSVTGAILLQGGELLIDKDLTLDGPGPAQLSVEGRANPALPPIFRVFRISAGTVAISGLRISNGHHYAGAGILNGGTLTLNNCVISGNVAEGTSGLGGGLANQGTLTVTACRFSANAGVIGGAFCAFAGSTGVLNDCLVEGNQATRGGGLANEGGNLTVNRCTISGNTAASMGGGVVNDSNGALWLNATTVAGNDGGQEGGGLLGAGGQVTLINSTISGNRAARGAGLSAAGAVVSLDFCTVTANANCTQGGGLNGPVTLGRSIVAGNSATGSPDIAGRLTSLGFNLIGDGTGAAAGSFDPSDRVGTAVNPVDPRLGPLQASGGPTPTHALLYGSPAVDGANCAGAPLVDQRGLSRPQGASCDIGAVESQFNSNLIWPLAARLDLTPTGIPGVLGGSADQSFGVPGEVLWYKFSIVPGGQVIVSLSGVGNECDVVVYKDIAAAFQTLNSPEDLARLNAEFNADSVTPEAAGSEALNSERSSPLAYSPLAYSPLAYSPLAYSPLAYSPLAYSPLAYSPLAYSPLAYSPLAYSPLAYSPLAYSPLAYSPLAYSPLAYSPLAYSSAQLRSIVALAVAGGGAGNQVVVNTWDNSTDFYVSVNAHSGGGNLATPLHLDIQLLTGPCGQVSALLPAATMPIVPGSHQTLILTDLSRLAGTGPEKFALKTKLEELAARAEVNGVVVDFGGLNFDAAGNITEARADARVLAANLQADAHPECTYAKNLVAEAVNEVIRGYRALAPLEYIVIVGNDNVIPFFRHPDQALTANENKFEPPVRDNTASQASLRLGQVLSQDDYAATCSLSRKAGSIPLPDLAIGRLVETPAEILRLLTAYLKTAAGVVAPPGSSLVTGYDFLEDAAEAIGDQLDAGLGVPAQRLITPNNVPPQQGWNADALRAALLGRRHDLIFLAGHFNAYSALAADFSTTFSAAELAAANVDLENAIVVSVGCHSGYNIVNADALPGLTPEPDWAQAFAQKGATWIAGSGYQYGDTDFIEYSERLYLELFKALRASAGPSPEPVPVGKALVAAKKSYLANVAQMRGIHEKALLEATLYGLPMLSVNLPGQRLDPGAADFPINPQAYPATPKNPGHELGLTHAEVNVQPSLTLHERDLEFIPPGGAVVDPGVTVHVSYLAGSGAEERVVTSPTEPVLPLEVLNVSARATTLRGVGFLGGHYLDEPGVIPLTGAPATEARGVHSPFFVQEFYPIQPWSVNYFDAVCNGAAATTRLMAIPAQFKSNGDGTERGTRRRFVDMRFRLFYSSQTATYQNGNIQTTPALAAAPQISRVSGVSHDGLVDFTVQALGDPAAGMQEVWITYAATDNLGAGEWQSLSLVQQLDDTTLWKGTLPLNGAPAGALRFMAQAVNGVGLVALDTRQGAYYAPQDPQARPPAPTVLNFQPGASGGPYDSDAAFAAVLTSGGSPLAHQWLTFSLGTQNRQAQTDGNGLATVALPLNVAPGQYQVQVAFAGSPDFAPSSDASPVVSVTKRDTVLTVESFTPCELTVKLNQAPWAGASGRPLAERTVFFVINNGSEGHAVSAITDFAGRATLHTVPLPPGAYTLSASFTDAQIVSLGRTLTLVDRFYGAPPPTTVNMSLAPLNATLTYLGDTRLEAGSVLRVKVQVTSASPLADLARGEVAFDIIDQDTSALVAQTVGPVAADGSSSALVNGLKAGSYRIRATLGYPCFQSSAAFEVSRLAVVDTTPPALSCPGHLETVADAGGVSAVVDFQVLAYDDSGIRSVVCTPPSGSRFPVGTTSVEGIATDNSGLVSKCAFTIRVAPPFGTPATIVCPGNIVASTDPGQCAALIPFAVLTEGNPLPSVQCRVGATLIGSPFAFPAGVTTVSCTADNGFGAAVCAFTVTVEDHEPPSIQCPPDITVSTLADVPSPNPARVAVTDNCPGASVVWAGDSVPGDWACGGAIRRSYQATDAHGNTAVCVQTILVRTQLVLNQEHVLVHYHAKDAPGASLRNRAYSRAGIRGELRFCDPLKLPEDLLAAPTANQLQARVQARLGGLVIADDVLTLQVSGDNRSAWTSPPKRSGPVEALGLSWEKGARFWSETSNPLSPRMGSESIGTARSLVWYEARPGTYLTLFPQGVSVSVINGKLNAIGGLPVGAYQLQSDRRRVRLQLPYRLALGMTIATTGAINDTIKVALNANYQPPEADFQLRLRADGVAVLPLFQATPDTLQYEITLGTGPAEHPATGRSVIGTADKPWDRNLNNHKAFREEVDD